jgi:hypothetical protein
MKTGTAGSEESEKAIKVAAKASAYYLIIGA